MKEIIIWPVYLDSEKSRKEGRKIPKELGVKNPKLKDIFSALKKMGYNAEIVKNKSYPKECWESSGYIKVKVDENISKLDVIKKVLRI